MENSSDKRQFSVTASDYEILEEIGQGVSATVYRARCIPFDEIVAIKSLDLEKCNSNLDEIRKEAATMSMISHPSVVRAHCSFVVDQHLWVVMPYLSGGSCLHIMKAAFPDGFEEPVIATILKETLKALEYLHRHGHIHRDVKAGNILVDSSGVVKLADFGVSACMFDTGDRQRSRQTFVGTPCWMAPEVMEQLHGYDFKADIWSFGITALELAHGHAPFSKYPPMKVLLMTLQNAPPGLDQERDKGRFSKAFKEMIAMCLVKDPAKRPAAEKLLKHAFFKHAKSPDYVAKLLLGLPPLGERVKTLKVKDQARLAQKKVPMEEQEAKSQNEYKRGVSSWNFNVEDLKAQAALLEDEDDDGSKVRSRSASDHDQELPSQSQAPSPATTPPLQSGRGDAAAEGNGGGPVRPKGTPVPQPSQKVGNGPKYGPMPVARKEPKHIGRFDVFEDDYGESPEFRSGEHYMQRHVDRQRPLSGPLDPQRVISGARTSQSDEATNTGMRPGHERVQSQSDRFVGGVELRHSASAKSFSGALPSAGCAEDRPKGVPFVQKKGRFSVTSEDVDLEEDAPSARVIGTSRAAVSVSKSASSADVTVERRISGGPASASMPSISTHAHATVPVTALTPHLHQILNYMSATQDTILMLMNSISPSDMGSARTGSKSNLLSRAGSLSHSESGNESFSADREQQLMHQVAELQSKLSTVMEEMQHLKLRNVQLERQLNAIYNEEEERRIQQEESRKEGGS